METYCKASTIADKIWGAPASTIKIVPTSGLITCLTAVRNQAPTNEKILIGHSTLCPYGKKIKNQIARIQITKIGYQIIRTSVGRISEKQGIRKKYLKI